MLTRLNLAVPSLTWTGRVELPGRRGERLKLGLLISNRNSLDPCVMTKLQDNQSVMWLLDSRCLQVFPRPSHLEEQVIAMSRAGETIVNKSP